jgi:hypothetical protein
VGCLPVRSTVGDLYGLTMVVLSGLKMGLPVEVIVVEVRWWRSLLLRL